MFTDSTQWDRVCTFSADKLNELGQVSLFAKKLHALEAEHARDLAKLCEKFLSGVPAEKRGVLERVMAAAAAEQDDGAEEREEPPISLGATWASVLEEMALRARRAELVADRLDAQVVRPLGQHILELDGVRRSVVASGQRETKRLHDMHTALKQAQSQYLKDKATTDDAGAKLERAQNTPGTKEKELKKLREKWEGASVKLAAAGEQLAKQEALCGAEQQLLYKEVMPGLLQQLQRQEARRAHSLLTVLENLQGLGKARAEEDLHASVCLGATMALADGELDAQEFAAQGLAAGGAGAAVAAMSLLSPVCKGRLLVAKDVPFNSGGRARAPQWREELVVLMQRPPSAQTGAEFDCPTLYVFRAENSSSPRAVLPLVPLMTPADAGDDFSSEPPASPLLAVHVSVHGRANVFRVAGADGSHLFQCVDDDELALWLSAARTVVEGQRKALMVSAHFASLHAGGGRSSAVAAPPTFPSARMLSLSILEAKHLPRAADYAVHAVLDGGGMVCRSPMARGGPEQPVAWGAHFTLEQLPLAASELRLLLVSKPLIGSVGDAAAAGLGGGGRKRSLLLGQNVLGQVGAAALHSVIGGGVREEGELIWTLGAAAAGASVERWERLGGGAAATGESFKRDDGSDRNSPRPLGDGGRKGSQPANKWQDALERTVSAFTPRDRAGSTPPLPRSGALGGSRDGGDDAEPIALRVRVLHETLLLRPADAYEPLVAALADEPRVLSALLETAAPQEREPLAEALLHALNSHGAVGRALEALVRAEVASVGSEASLLFRGNSGVTKLLEVYARLTAGRYRRATLGPFVEKLVASRDAACEVDPGRGVDERTAERNWRTLLSHMSALWTVVVNAERDAPPAMRTLLAHVRAAVADAPFAADEHAASKAVGGIYFLRFLCPALLHPHAHGVTKEPPTEAAARTLTLLTKALTNLANLVEFGKKEPYLEQFNEGFIRPNVPFMTALTTALSRERGSAGDDEGRLALPPCDLRFRLAQLLVFLKRKPDAVMDAARKGGFDGAAQAAYDAATAIEDYRGSTAPELEVSASADDWAQVGAAAPVAAPAAAPPKPRPSLRELDARERSETLTSQKL